MEVSFLPELISAFADTFLVLSISPLPCPPERFWVNTHFYEYAINHFFLKASDGRLFAYLRQFISEREEILTQTPVAKPSSEILSRIYKRCVRQSENRMYRKVPVRLGKGRWETYTTTVVKGTHRFPHGCYGRHNALLGTTKTADLTGPCPIKSDGYPSRILYSVSLQA